MLNRVRGKTWGFTATRTHASPKGDNRRIHFVPSSQGAGHPNNGSSYLPLPNSPVRRTLPSAWTAPTKRRVEGPVLDPQPFQVRAGDCRRPGVKRAPDLVPARAGVAALEGRAAARRRASMRVRRGAHGEGAVVGGVEVVRGGAARADGDQ